MSLGMLIATPCAVGASDTNAEAEHKTTSAYTELSTYHEFLECCNKDKHILIKFHAPWCGGCKEIEPAFDEVAHKHADHVTAVSVNIDNHAIYDKLAHFVDRGIPTIVLLDPSGSREIAKQIGSSDAPTLEKMITQHIRTSNTKHTKRNADHQQSTQQTQLPEITTFNGYQSTITNNSNVAIVLHADWCSPCARFKPTCATLAQKKPHVYFCTLNIDLLKHDNGLHNELASYAQNGIPTTVLIQDGIIIHSVTGAYPESSLAQVIHDTFGTQKQQQTHTSQTTSSTEKAATTQSQNVTDDQRTSDKAHEDKPRKMRRKKRRNR